MISEKNEIKFDSVNLSEQDFIDKGHVHEQDFQYGSVSGIAEMIGFQIIIFRKIKSDKNSYLSIDWGENENPIILEIAQKLLLGLGSKLLLKDKLIDVEKLYGKANYIDNLYEGSITYHYFNKKKDLLYAFGIDNSLGITRIELIHDAEIVKERIDYLTTTKPKLH